MKTRECPLTEMQGNNIYQNEFSQLLENPIARIPEELQRKLPTIARAGISILFPARRMEDFLQLIASELAIQQTFLSPTQPVCCLRMRGFPLRQCSVEQLTELLFRLCTRYKILEAENGERKIDLTHEQCTSDHLALLKGLGFNHIRVFVDGSIAGHDRSLEPVKRAISTIHDFSGFSVGIEVLYSADTSRDYLKNLVNYLFECGIDEIEFQRNQASPMLPQELRISHETFRILVETLQKAGYRLLGDRCFKREDHGDFALLEEGKLGYGPWGFYNSAITEWLGLGPGADGLIAGYLYHNSSNLDIYRSSLSENRSPICSWSRQPVVKEKAFEFIQHLYCEHRVSRELFYGRMPLLEKFKERNWIEENNKGCLLTAEGILHLHSICNAFSLYEAVEKQS